MRKVKVAATQMACTRNREENIANAEAMVREAASRGANVILLQELTLENIMCTKGLLLKKMVMYMSLDILNVEIKGS